MRISDWSSDVCSSDLGRGRHTSTSAYMLPLPGDDGWIIDTPGIRSFGLAHVQPENLIEAFPDLDEMTEDCPRGCTHGEDEPECGLDVAMTDGDVDPEREIGSATSRERGWKYGK